MFFNRLGVFFGYLIGIPAGIAVMLGSMILFDKLVPTPKFIFWMEENSYYILGIILALMLFYGFFRLIKWLFIEPFLAWKEKRHGLTKKWRI